MRKAILQWRAAGGKLSVVSTPVEIPQDYSVAEVTLSCLSHTEQRFPPMKHCARMTLRDAMLRARRMMAFCGDDDREYFVTKNGRPIGVYNARLLQLQGKLDLTSSKCRVKRAA